MGAESLLVFPVGGGIAGAIILLLPIGLIRRR